MKKQLLIFLTLSSLSLSILCGKFNDRFLNESDSPCLESLNFSGSKKLKFFWKQWLSGEPAEARCFLDGCDSSLKNLFRASLVDNIGHENFLFKNRGYIKRRGIRLQQLPLTLHALFTLWKNAGEEQKKVFDECSIVLPASQVYTCGYQHFVDAQDPESDCLFRRALVTSLILNGQFNPDITQLVPTSNGKNLTYSRERDISYEGKHFVHLAHQAGDLEVVAVAIDVIKRKNPERGALFEQAYLPGRITERMMAVLINSLRPKVATTHLLNLDESGAAGEGRGWNAELDVESEELFATEESE